LPPKQLIARLGRWLRTALTLSYLRFFKPEGLLSAGGWLKDRMDSFAERFCIEVPEALVALVFPCLAALRTKVGLSQAMGTMGERRWHVARIGCAARDLGGTRVSASGLRVG
jgi:hypothetical protein